MSTYHSIASSVGDDLDLLGKELVVERLGEQARSLALVLLGEILLDIPRLVYGRSAIIEDQDGELLQWVVLRSLCRCVPRDFIFHLKWYALLEHGDAVLARIGRGSGAD